MENMCIFFGVMKVAYVMAVFVLDLEVLNEAVPCFWCQRTDVCDVRPTAPSPAPHPISPPLTNRKLLHKKWKTCFCFGVKVGNGGEGGLSCVFRRCNQK
jgi:hypothetical protein